MEIIITSDLQEWVQMKGKILNVSAILRERVIIRTMEHSDTVVSNISFQEHLYTYKVVIAREPCFSFYDILTQKAVHLSRNRF